MKKIRTIRRTQEHNEILDNSFITPGRFRELDGLRGIAALSVVAYHFGYPAVQNYPRIAPAPHSISLGEHGGGGGFFWGGGNGGWCPPRI